MILAWHGETFFRDLVVVGAVLLAMLAAVVFTLAKVISNIRRDRGSAE